MSLKEKISADYMSAFRAKNTVAKNLLSVVKGEIQTIEKNTGVETLSDDEITKILNKTVKSLNETLKSLAPVDGKGEDILQTVAELAILQCYLPKQMSKDEITQKIVELKESGITNIGQIMKEFASLPVDRKIVSEVIKEVM